MIESYGEFWQQVYDVMVLLHLWPAFPVIFGTMLLGGLAIWFAERLMGGGKDE